MHIDWFLVLIFTVAFIFAGWSLWLTGRRKVEKNADDEGQAEVEDATSH